ncbi:methyltransferase domain-containing protein [Rhizobium sp. P40RR-XXII]|uniref:methyltransferase domain-containing protein n=1 Tax=unclassified Rhizobium TaxID=2613769 RepID=UPI001456C354|nr:MULTISPECIES: methyltransferase domain-containing protein [unclassified Rhizobium]NLR84839.1 methyltransferase domain-containing protein [Rhizobium sp. P28RR-XV]NLS16254.1 methyltransferase domain-containing protein [Rhizobium sp. P40RR-XXII]
MVYVDVQAQHLEGFAETLLRCNHLYHPSNDSLALLNAVKSRQQIEIFDYSHSADAFTRAFGMRNSLKCLRALANLGPAIHGYERVCDLGCGSGAFSLAFAYLADNPNLELHGLDASETQLLLGEELMSAAGLPGSFVFERRNLPTQIDYLPDLTISSYWFCENEHVITDPVLFDLMVGREMLIVDYEKIIDRIATSLPRGFHVLARHSALVEIPAALTDFVAQEWASVYSIHISRTAD